mgnify:CR=1 FL=1
MPCLANADSEISAAARQVNADLLEQAQQAQQQQQQQLKERGSGGLAATGATRSLDSKAVLAAVRWGVHLCCTSS